jgi:flagellar basal body-associated protein FliL
MTDKNDVFKVDENQQSKDKQKKVVFVLGIAIVIVAITLTVILIGALSSAGDEEESGMYETTEGSYSISTTTGSVNMDDWFDSDGDVTVGAGDNNSVNENVNSNTKAPITLPGTTSNKLIESYENLPVNGVNKLSDHYNNEFIKLVSDNYDVDSDLLVAIYSVPDTGTNFVLEFSGKTDSDDEYVKSPDTLVRVYQIDKDKNIKIATGKPTGNVGVTYPESVMIVAMIKTTVMQQHPDYFTGVN